MTRFSATAIAAVLLCLFGLSVSHIPPGTDDTSTAVSLPIPETSIPKEPTVNAETESDSSVAVSSVPLKKLTFLPVNRHVEIPYAHDTIVASGENSGFEDPESIHGGRGWWVRMHHHHHDDSDSDDEPHHHHHDDSDSDDEDDDDDKIEKISLKRRDFDRFEGEKGFKSWKKMKKHHFRHEKAGFMNRVRKFFDHYF